MKYKKHIAIFLILSLLFSGLVWSDNDELKRKERELNALKEKIEELDASISNNQQLQNKTNQKIQSTTNSIRALEEDIVILNGNIDTTESDIEIKIEELASAEIEIGNKNELLYDRMRVMYKTGSIGYLEVLFGAEDFTDLLSRIDMVQKILVHDQNLIAFLKEQRDIISDKKLALETKRAELVLLYEDKKIKQNALEGELNQLLAYKEDLKDGEAALAEVEETLLEEADQLTSLIKNLELSATYVGGEMQWPVPGQSTITSDFGIRIHPITKVEKMHTGVDISSPMNTTVVAAQSGTVIYADWYGGYGKVVMIDHGGGYTTLYGHNNSILVTVGQAVNKGDAIAKSGSTGYSTGPHLHFEVRVNGEYVDPIPYVKGN